MMMMLKGQYCGGFSSVSVSVKGGSDPIDKSKVQSKTEQLPKALPVISLATGSNREGSKARVHSMDCDAEHNDRVTDNTKVII